MNTPRYIKNFWEESFSEIIDVRSEGEYNEDHIPGAVNLPVLNNDERAIVGTIYMQNSPFEAKKIGSSYISSNIAVHLRTHFAAMDKLYLPLIYCWRGGLRSQSMALVLSQIGWRTTVVEGGYKTYRKRVRHIIEEWPRRFSFVALQGFTGSGKTLILSELEKCGSQVLNLEMLANHKGSLLGTVWDTMPLSQPSQKMFESMIAHQLQRFDPARFVWIESESNKIGKIHLPTSLCEAMKSGDSVEIEMPREARAEYLYNEYSHFSKNHEHFKSLLQKLVVYCGRKNVDRWCGCIDRGDLVTVAVELLAVHYDPTYKRALSKTYRKPKAVFRLENVSDANLTQLVHRLQQFESTLDTELKHQKKVTRL